MFNTIKNIFLKNSNTAGNNAIRVPDYYKENPKVQFQFLLGIMSSYLYENLKNEGEWLLLNYDREKAPCRFEKINGDVILTIVGKDKHTLSLGMGKNRDIGSFCISDELCGELYEIMMAYGGIDGVIANLTIKHRKYILNEVFSDEYA